MKQSKDKKIHFNSIPQNPNESIRICIEVKNGEISYAESAYNHRVTRTEFHDLFADIPRWDLVKILLKDCLISDKDDFYQICSMMNKTSKAYTIAQEILKERKEAIKSELEKINLLTND